jgi:uncharacterized protein (DUF2237 family)
MVLEVGFSLLVAMRWARAQAAGLLLQVVLAAQQVAVLIL